MSFPTSKMRSPFRWVLSLGIALGTWSFCLIALVAFLVVVCGHTLAPYVSMAIAAILTPIIALALIITFAFWLKNKLPSEMQVMRWLASLALFMPLQFIGTVFVADARDPSYQYQARCEQLLPFLEAYRTEKGRYPKDLDALDAFSPLPEESKQCSYSLFADSWHHRSPADGFELYAPGPGFTDAFYSSEAQEWEYIPF